MWPTSLCQGEVLTCMHIKISNHLNMFINVTYVTRNEMDVIFYNGKY